MKTAVFALAIALMGAASVNAQSTATAVSNGASHECIMSTDAQAWASLGLTPEQTKKVQEVQAACKKECEAMKSATDDKGTVEKDALDKHEAQIKAVLTADQYTKWVAWCKDHASKAGKK